MKGRRPTGKTLMDFWRWSSSDLACNAMRGVLAEYLVACDLGVDDGLRVEWDTQDIVTKTGIKVEVKSAAYCQSWAQQKPSKIQFGIGPSREYDFETCTYSEEIRRRADVYVFCILAHQDITTLNPLDTDQWEFYVLPATVLDRHSPIQKSISLSTLFALRPTKARYGEISSVIDRLAAAKPLGPSSDAP